MPTKKASSTKKTSPKKPAAKATKKPAAKKPVARKTSVKKATAKKLAPKKGASRSTTKKPTKDLVYAADHESFWVTNGEILNSLVALADAFSGMEKDVFRYHVAGSQNDFACWVDDVLCDTACAKALKKAKTPKSAHTVVVKHLKLYAV